MEVIRFCIKGVYTSFYIYFMESYPTPLRSLGFGLNSTFGNLVSIVSPIILEFFNKYILYFIFAVLSGVNNIFLTFFLKETVGKSMLETIEELEVPNVDKEKLIPGRDSDIGGGRDSDINKGANTSKGEKKPLMKDKEEKEETGEEYNTSIIKYLKNIFTLLIFLIYMNKQWL